MVIDHLLARQDGGASGHGVAYLYFGYQDQTQQRPIDVFSIFTKQLLCQLPELPPDIEDVYNKKRTESLDADTLKGLLFSMPARFSALNPSRRTFIVCDALDEMDKDRQRAVLLPLFHEMAHAGFEIFMTSRPHPADVRESFDSAIQLDIIPDQNDLRRYIQGKLSANVKIMEIINNSISLKLEDIVSALVTSTEGM